MDMIVVLKDGEIEEKGHYSDLMGARNAFYRLIKDYSRMERRRSHSTLKLQRRSSSAANIFVVSEEASKHKQMVAIEADSGQLSSSSDIDDDGTTDLDTSEGEEADLAHTQDVEIVDVKKDTKAELVAAEKMKEGEVGFGVLLVYAKAA